MSNALRAAAQKFANWWADYHGPVLPYQVRDAGNELTAALAASPEPEQESGLGEGKSAIAATSPLTAPAPSAPGEVEALLSSLENVIYLDDPRPLCLAAAALIRSQAVHIADLKREIARLDFLTGGAAPVGEWVHKDVVAAQAARIAELETIEAERDRLAADCDRHLHNFREEYETSAGLRKRCRKLAGVINEVRNVLAGLPMNATAAFVISQVTNANSITLADAELDTGGGT